MLKEFLSAIRAIPAQFNQERADRGINEETSKHLFDALKQSKEEGQRLAVFARWIALAIISIMLPFIFNHWSVIYYHGFIVLFCLIGYLQLRAAQVGQSRRELALIMLDLILMTSIFIVPNPFIGENWPSAMQVRFGNFPFYFVLLAAATVAYSWRTVLSFGTWAAGFWLIGNGLLAWLGYDDPELAKAIIAAAPDARFAEIMDPNLVLGNFRIQEAVIIMLVAGILAANGWRTNRLLLRQINVERERENLSRHFAPAMVEQLAGHDTPFGETRSQKVAVLFADIVGFTAMAEAGKADEMVALLREFHKRLEVAIFDNNGTLDKFLGDGVMATFGNPVSSPDDCTNAILCARQMQASMKDWNEEREEAGKLPINLSVGIHYGEVILGDIGSDRRLEFATLGDTVNVASRLEELTRTLGANIVFSDALIKELGNRDENDQLLNGFEPVSDQKIRGRQGAIEVWRHCA